MFDLFVEAGPPSIYTAARCLCVFILSIYPYCASIILQRKNIANEKGVLLAPQYIKNTIAGAMVTSLAKRQRKAKTQTQSETSDRTHTKHKTIRIEAVGVEAFHPHYKAVWP